MATTVDTLPGSGVVGRVHDQGVTRRIGVGGSALLESLSLAAPSSLTQEAAAREERGETVLYVSVDNEAVALLALRERVRASAETAVASLRQQGVALKVLTGDRSVAAERIGRRLDLAVQSAMGPADKIDRLRGLRETHPAIVMVGDGLNDAAILAEADVGIAMGEGASIALEAADVTLYNPDLHGVAWLKQLASNTARIIRQNLVWTFGYNTIGLVLAIGGLLHPIAAVIIMTLSSAFVIWNALRIKHQPSLGAT